ncbi:MAG: SHOCT domain-containing protein [Lacibacter sp.]
MKKKMYIKPSRASLIAGMIAVVIFLVFGIVFLFLLADESSSVGMIAVSVWIVFVLLIGALFLYKFINYNKGNSGDEEFFFSDEREEEVPTFDERLRKLEALYKDKLITEAEYRKKRAEIMQSKW